MLLYETLVTKLEPFNDKSSTFATNGVFAMYEMMTEETRDIRRDLIDVKTYSHNVEMKELFAGSGSAPWQAVEYCKMNHAYRCIYRGER